jgi:hypothetical protein
VDSNPRSPCGGWRLGLLPRSYGKFRRANCGSHLTHRRRKTDSNPRSPVRETSIFEAPLVRHNLPASAREIEVSNTFPSATESVSGMSSAAVRRRIGRHGVVVSAQGSGYDRDQRHRAGNRRFTTTRHTGRRRQAVVAPGNAVTLGQLLERSGAAADELRKPRAPPRNRLDQRRITSRAVLVRR